eukprot:scaffold65690_cov72-Cyclotella_meneghiniana.AAC.1
MRRLSDWRLARNWHSLIDCGETKAKSRRGEEDKPGQQPTKKSLKEEQGDNQEVRRTATWFNWRIQQPKIEMLVWLRLLFWFPMGGGGMEAIVLVRQKICTRD